MISGALGLLIGLQRQQADSALAGIRTFPLIAIVGTLCAMLSHAAAGPSTTGLTHAAESGAGWERGWILGAGLLGVAIATAMGNYLRAKPDRSPGITTEVAILVMYVIGAMVWIGPREVAVAAGVLTAILLALKAPMHAFASRISEADVRSILRFAVLAFVILPIVPDKAIDPLGAINPHHIWLMLVLVVGISLAAYLLNAFVPPHRAAVINGLLGGMISSTATTASQARLSRTDPANVRTGSLVIVLASTVVFARVLIEIGVVGHGVFADLSPRVFVMLGCGVLVSAIVYALTLRRSKGPEPVSSSPPQHTNPSEIRPAIVFALLFTLVGLGVAYARREFGDTGLWVVSALSGLTDMDSITLSTARLAQEGKLTPDAAGRAIVIAGTSNLLFKGVLVSVLGGSWRHRVPDGAAAERSRAEHSLARGVWPWLGLMAACGLAVAMW